MSFFIFYYLLLNQFTNQSNKSIYAIIYIYYNFLMVQLDYGTLIYASIGGLILGIATTLNYVIRGKVTGMSGIIFGIISFNKSEIPEKVSIVGGMFFISSVFFMLFGYKGYEGFIPFGPQTQIDAWATLPGFLLSGFLVGFGTKLGNGCTSGHGLCGIARLSIRSFVAVLTFLVTAILISTFDGWKMQFLKNSTWSTNIKIDHNLSANVICGVGLFLPIFGLILKKPQTKLFSQIVDQLIVFIVGILFAIGLMVSGMSRRKNILDFLKINQNWNPALLCVLSCGLIVNLVAFSLVKNKKKSLNGSQVFNPKNNTIDWKLIFGAFCFGLGWGIGGLCPGPFLVLCTVFTFPIQILWGGGLIVGMYLANKVSSIGQQKNIIKKVK